MKYLKKLPWIGQQREIDDLRADIIGIKKALIKARVANFVLIHDYRHGDNLSYDITQPISLEQLRKDVDELLELD